MKYNNIIMNECILLFKILNMRVVYEHINIKYDRIRTWETYEALLSIKTCFLGGGSGDRTCLIINVYLIP